jgi:hypothetical protein
MEALEGLPPTVADVILMLAPPAVFFLFSSLISLVFGFAPFSLSKVA